MNLPTNPSASRERRVDEAIASYLAALDAGAAPGAEDWLAAHPDLAPELESFLRQYRRVDELADPLRRAAAAQLPEQLVVAEVAHAFARGERQRMTVAVVAAHGTRTVGPDRGGSRGGRRVGDRGVRAVARGGHLGVGRRPR